MFHHVKIQAGIAKAINDTNSAEQGIIETIDLTSGGASGYGLDPVDGWVPQIAQTKGGLWADSETIEGRILLSQHDQNVVETLTFSVHSGDVKDTAFLMNRLRRVSDLARDFWQTQTQIEPVYLNVWFLNAPGPQYALIYSMNIAERMDVSDTTKRFVTVTLEREPYWRALPPGANPKLWSFYKLGLDAGVDYGLSNLSLIGGTNHFKQVASLPNRVEHDGAFTIFTQNWLDFAADEIDGDVPALVGIGIDTSDSLTAVEALYYGFSYYDATIPDENGATINQFHTLNIADRTGRTVTGTSTLSTQTDADCNKIYSGSTRAYFSEAMSAGATVRYDWRGTAVPFTQALWSGNYMVFLRAGVNNSPGTGVTAQFQMLFPSTVLGAAITTQSTDPVTLFDTIAQTSKCLLGLSYLGQVQLPVGDIQNVASEGMGQYVGARTTIPDIEFRLLISNTSAGSRTVESLDVIMIPITPYSGKADIIVTQADYTALIDGTGYTGRGKLPNAVLSFSIESPQKDPPIVRQLIGGLPVLIPGRINRLHLFTTRLVANIPRSDGASLINVYVNIIPRWRGVRDA